MTLENTKQAIAHLVILIYKATWLILRKLTSKRFPSKECWLYYAMKFFNLFKKYEVKMEYLNPLVSGKMINLKLDLKQNTDLHYFTTGGEHEIEWIKALHSSLREGMTFVDIGAGIGIFSVTLALANEGVRCIAFEPHRENYARLLKQANQAANIECINCAISNTSGEIDFYVDPINDGAGSIVKKKYYFTEDIKLPVVEYQKKHPDFNPVIKVKSKRLDDVIKGKSSIKIDVDGGELDVLKSATKTFEKRLVDVMVIEVRGETFKDAVLFLKQHDFLTYIYGKRLPVSEDYVIKTNIFNIFNVFNILAIHKDSKAIERVDFDW